jgi:hypothetical protein
MAKNGNIHPTRIFRTPQEMELAWIAYKEDLEIQSKEWLKVQYVGKEGQRMTDAYKLPLVLEGFYVFCYKNYGVVKQYFVNTDNMFDEFLTICSHIKEEIRSNQITGGLLGVYNPSITQRLNNLAENTKTELTGSLNIPNIPDIGKRE